MKKAKMTPQELTAWMQLHSITKPELAEFLGVTEPAVDHWLRGRRDIPATVTKVLKFFNVYPQLKVSFQ